MSEGDLEKTESEVQLEGEGSETNNSQEEGSETNNSQEECSGTNNTQLLELNIGQAHEGGGGGGGAGDSGVYRIEVQNLPKYHSMTQIKTFLKKLHIKPKNLKAQKHHAFFNVGNYEEQCKAIDLINGYRWKNKELRAKATSSAERNRDAKLDLEEVVVGTNASEDRQEDGTVVVDEDTMLDAVTPLRNKDYEEQLRLKEYDSFLLIQSICKEIQSVSKVPFPPAQKFYGTIDNIRPVGQHSVRNKCEFTIGLSSTNSLCVGFKAFGFRKGGQCPVLSPQNCIHLSPEMKACVEDVQDFLVASGKPPFEPGINSGFWKTLTLRHFGAELMLILTFYPQNLTETEMAAIGTSLSNRFIGSYAAKKAAYVVTSVYIVSQINTSDTPVYQHFGGSEFVEETMFGKLSFRISPASFFQTCTKAAEVLYGVIGEECEGSGEGALIDICCGTGTIGISLAEKFKSVIGIELCSEAVEDAKINATKNGVENCRFVRGKAEELFQEVRHYLPSGCNDVTGILDPPRAGIHDRLIGNIRRMDVMKKLIYVSCEPKIARKNFVDLCRLPSNKFGGNPFKLKKVIPVDMFPNTKHFEWVLVFER